LTCSVPSAIGNGRGSDPRIVRRGVAIRCRDTAEAAGWDRNDRNLRAVELSEGFIARSGYDDEPGPESWGKQVFPRFYVERGDGWSPSTLSLWKDLESPMAFAYAGIHGEARRHGREWFLKPAWPPYVLWWVEPNQAPSWSEAIVRHASLHDRGASPFAFDFKMPFDDTGAPTTIDRERVKQLMKLNVERQWRLIQAESQSRD
jgi:hypothetical protein